MKIISNMALKDFEFWSGAKNFAAKLTEDELDTIEYELEDIYPEGMSDMDVNDIFWFDREFICELLGENEEDIWNREE